MQYKATTQLALTWDFVKGGDKAAFWGKTVCKYQCNVQFVFDLGGTSIRLPCFITFA